MEKQIKIGAKSVTQGRYIAFQMAEVAISGPLFGPHSALISNLARRRLNKMIGGEASIERMSDGTAADQ